MRLGYLESIVLGFSCTTIADQFYYPPDAGPALNYVDNPVWSLGSSQSIRWTTANSSYNITLYQQNLDVHAAKPISSIYIASGDAPGNQAFLWTVQTYGSDLSFSPVYFLWLNPNSSYSTTSHYFNITLDDGQSTASSSIQTSTTSSTVPLTSSTESSGAIVASSTASSSTTDSSTRSVPTSTSATVASTSLPSATTSLPTDHTTNSNSVALKVGLGVGLGVGIPLVLIAGIWLGIKLVRQRRSFAEKTGSNMSLVSFPDQQRQQNPPFYSQHQPNQMHEAPSQDHQVHEVSEKPLSPVEMG